jgi:drug/metabolite transporter (DMT)-like permease
LRPATVGLLCAVLGALGFSFKAVLVKQAYRYGVDPATLLALRMLYALPFFIAMAAHAARREARPIARGDWLSLLVLGFFGYYLSSYTDFLGLQYISAGLERVILYTYPSMIVLLTAVIQRRLPQRQLLAALALCYLGVALAVWHDVQVQQRNLPLGVTLVLASALSFAIYMMRSAATIKRLGAARVTAWATGLACLMVITQFVMLRPVSTLWSQPWPVQACGLGMAVFCTVLPIWLTSHAVQRLGPSRTAITSTLGPVFTLFLAWATLGESLSWRMLGGALLVVLGVRWIAQPRPLPQPVAAGAGR